MTWYSQAGQDEWVHSLHPTPGFFVDVGAYDGIEHSNTYALETEHGWSGLCIEPNPVAFASLAANRKAAVVQAAVADYIGSCRFAGDRRVAKGGIEVVCAPLPALVSLHRAPPIIDYLSIDVEGDDLVALAGMDFERWPIRMITVEHNLYRDGPALKDAIFDHLTARGFHRAVEDVVAPGYGPYEDWYTS